MAGAESYVQVPTDDSGKKLRTRTDTVGANDVHQEVVSIADPSTVTQIAGVDAGGQLKVVEASAATIAGDTTSIDGKVTACNTGDVTIGAALPAGANAIGKLAANTGVDIGDVDVTSIVPLTGATNLGKAEDALHTTGDTGVAILGVRNDTPTSMVDVDLDYTNIAVDEYGRTQTRPVDTETSMDHGSNLDIDTSAEQITSNTFTTKHGVLLKAASTNSGILYIGNSDVTDGDTAATDGIPLSAGEWIVIPVNNPSTLYAIGSVANQKIFWMAV